MKWPLKIDKAVDRRAIKWLIKFLVVWFLIARVIWKTDWVRQAVAEYYCPVVAGALSWLVEALGREAAVESATLFLEGSRLAFVITPDCTGLYGGFFIFLAVVLTLPVQSQPVRLLWILGGGLTMIAANLIRLTALILISADRPDYFDLLHETSDVFNMVVGCVLCFLAVKRLSLNPLGVKVFRREAARTST